MTDLAHLTGADITDDVLAEIAQRFEEFDYDTAQGFGPDDEVPPHLALVQAKAACAFYEMRAEAVMREAVDAARAKGLSWHKIGLSLGTTGEAARQRYAHA